jgi:hypothetical protein
MKSRRKFLDFNLSIRKIKPKKLAVTKKSRLKQTHPRGFDGSRPSALSDPHGPTGWVEIRAVARKGSYANVLAMRDEALVNHE